MAADPSRSRSPRPSGDSWPLGSPPPPFDSSVAGLCLDGGLTARTPPPPPTCSAPPSDTPPDPASFQSMLFPPQPPAGQPPHLDATPAAAPPLGPAASDPGLDVNSLLTSLGDSSIDPRPDTGLFDPFAFAAMQQQQQQQAPPAAQPQQLWQPPQVLNMSAPEPGLPPGMSYPPFFQAMNISDPSTSVGMSQLLPFQQPLSMSQPQSAESTDTPFASSAPGSGFATPSLPMSMTGSMQGMPSWHSGMPTPLDTLKAKSASPPASSEGAPVRGKKRVSEAPAAPGIVSSGPGPIRRGRARAATLDGTPKDLALKHRMAKTAMGNALLENPGQRIKSETSLAHKLTIHARDQAAPSAADADGWNILQPGSFDNMSSVMVQLQYRQQERLIRQANQPPDFSLQNQPAAAGSEKARRRARGKACDPDDKVPHNAIERRYRDNINERIATLRAAVPALSNLTPKNNGGSTSLLPRKPRKKGEPESLVDGVSAATKLNKATILGKATDYIHYLKRRETQLSSEAEGLKELIRSFQGGEDVLLVWLHEMEQTRQERAAEKARQEALHPIEEEHKPDELDDFLLDSDDEMSSSTAEGAGPSNPTGSYAMAAFLGLTLVGSSTDLHHPSSPHVAARAASASQQLLKRASFLSDDTHHYDQIPLVLLILEIARFVSFIACALFVLYPLYRTFSHHLASRHEHKRPARDAQHSFRQRKAAMRTKLASRRISPGGVDQALRELLLAPQSTVGAVGSLAQDVFFGFWSPKSSLLANSSKRMEGDVWTELLAVETAWGPFAQRSLAMKAHTILRVSQIVRVLDEHDASAESDEDDLTNGPEHSVDPTTVRVHALLGLALGRLGSPGNAVGGTARRYARAHWAHSQAAQGCPLWLADVVGHSLEQALALCPTEGEAAGVPNPDEEMRTFLSSPLLMASNTTQMHHLHRLWTLLFPAVVVCASPTTYASRAQRERETDADLPLSVDSNAFISEFFRRHKAKLLSVDLGKWEATDEVSTLLALVRDRVVRGTPAFYLTQMTLALWAFLSADPMSAKTYAQALVAPLTGGGGMLGTRQAAQACVELILDLTLPGDASASLGRDQSTLSLATAAADWLLLLRLMGRNQALFYPGAIEDTSAITAVLDQAMTLRRTLSHIKPQDCLRAKDFATDILADLSRFMGLRFRCFSSGASLSSPPPLSVAPTGLLWVPESQE